MRHGGTGVGLRQLNYRQSNPVKPRSNRPLLRTFSGTSVCAEIICSPALFILITFK